MSRAMLSLSAILIMAHLQAVLSSRACRGISRSSKTLEIPRLVRAGSADGDVVDGRVDLHLSQGVQLFVADRDVLGSDVSM